MRTTHIVAGGIWVGGSVVYLLVIGPGLKLGGASREVAAQVGDLFRRLVGWCIGALLISGVYLTFDRLTTTLVGGAYIGVLAAKIVAALVMFSLAMYQAQEARRLPKLRGKLWRVAPRLILWLGILTFLLGATLTGLFEGALAATQLAATH